MKKIFPRILLAICCIACSINDDEVPNFEFKLIPVDEFHIPDSLNYQQTYEATITYTIPNSCYYLNNIYYTETDSIRTVAINAYVDLGSNSCAEIDRKEEITIELKADQPFLLGISSGINYQF